MHKGSFPKKGYKYTFLFQNEVIYSDEKILDLSFPNLFSEILTKEGFYVTNTKEQDINLETNIVKTEEFVIKPRLANSE